MKSRSREIKLKSINIVQRIKAVLMIAPLILAISACSTSSKSIVNEDAEAFAATIQNSGVVVLDVRTSGEFESGHIANSVNIDVEAGSFENEIANLDKNAQYAVYCHSGRRSGIAAEMMKKMDLRRFTISKMELFLGKQLDTL
jgi:rhodanese-related sulfurtransferase